MTNYAGLLGKIMLDLIFIQGMKKLFYRFSILILTVGLLLLPSTKAFSTVGATAADLINLIQGWRAAAGNPPLTEDPLLNVTAYDTAYTMAVQELHSHIGNASGRISAYGYGDGSTVFCTENFAMNYKWMGRIFITRNSTWLDGVKMNRLCYVSALTTANVDADLCLNTLPKFSTSDYPCCLFSFCDYPIWFLAGTIVRSD